MRPDPFANNAFLSSLTEKIEQITPPSLIHLKDEMTEVVKSVIRETISKMNLVTREEFDIQSEVLAKNRNKLDLLEKRMAEMEKTICDLQGD